MTDLTDRIRASFDRQTFMQTLGARLDAVGPGTVTLSAALTDALRQQHGAGHAGVTFSLGDVAAGYAALTLIPEGQEVMTAEIKIHLLRPAMGERLEATGRVLKPGRRLMVVQSDIHAITGETRTHIATMLGTMVPVAP